jgi:hypothetical protein
VVIWKLHMLLSVDAVLPAKHRALFGAIAELHYALEEIEEAAAAADNPESETSILLPRQHLVPRSALADALDVLEARLTDFDQKLFEIERQRSGASDYADQDALIEYVTTRAGAQSLVAHELAAQRQVDIRGLSHVIEGLGRIVAGFVASVAPTVARVTRVCGLRRKFLVTRPEKPWRRGAKPCARLCAFV